MIGIRGLWQTNDRWIGLAAADAGGFGAGGNDLAWSATLGKLEPPQKSGPRLSDVQQGKLFSHLRKLFEVHG